MRCRTAFFTSVLTACIAGALWSADTEQKTYQIDLTVGDVQVSLNNGVTWNPAQLDQDLPESAVVKTADGSYCDISMPEERGSFRVMEKSELQFSKLGKSVKFSIKKGRSLFDIFKPLFGDETLEVETETAVASVRGTEFLVETENDTGTVSVADGTVLVRRNIPADVDQDIMPDFSDAVQMTLTRDSEIDFSRADNEQFLASVRKFRGNKAELRKFLRGERQASLKRIRAFKNRERIVNMLKRKKADYQKTRLRKAQMLKNRLQFQKKKASLQNMKKKIRMKRAMILRWRIMQYLKRRR